VCDNVLGREINSDPYAGSKYVAGGAQGAQHQGRDGFSPLKNREQADEGGHNAGPASAQDRSFSPPPAYERGSRSQPASTAGFSGFGDDAKGDPTFHLL
jgi:hypothetical protein